MKYDLWQQNILKAKGDILANTGRQVGKTTVFSHKIANYMLDNPNSQIIVVSLTEDQAQLIIIMIRSFLEKNFKTQIQQGKNKPTKSRIWIKNKARVISRPVGTTGDAVRGFTGDVLYIDEASGMPELMWKAAMPTLMTTGGQIWMSSTPRGKFTGKGKDKNFFFKCWENEDDRWQVFNIDSEKVMQDRTIDAVWTEEKRGKALAFLENQKLLLSDMEYRQEYLGEFLDDNRQWFDDELIIRQMTEDPPANTPKGDNLYLGVDVARMGDDESAFEVVQLKKDDIYHIENSITTKTLLSQTTKHIKVLHSLYDFSKIFIDSSGLGIGVHDFLFDDDDTKRQVVGIDFGKQVIDADGRTRKLMKTLLYSNMKRLMEEGKIHLLNDPKVFKSLKSIQYAYTNDSMGTRNLKIWGNDDHVADALAYACWCYKYKHLNFKVYSIKV